MVPASGTAMRDEATSWRSRACSRAAVSVGIYSYGLFQTFVSGENALCFGR